MLLVETWALALRNEHRLRVSDDRVRGEYVNLRGRKSVTGGGRKLWNEELRKVADHFHHVEPGSEGAQLDSTPLYAFMSWCLHTTTVSVTIPIFIIVAMLPNRATGIQIEFMSVSRNHAICGQDGEHCTFYKSLSARNT